MLETRVGKVSINILAELLLEDIKKEFITTGNVDYNKTRLYNQYNLYLKEP